MSFSGTPLGQGRRLDHQAFLKGVAAPNFDPQPKPTRHPPTSNVPLSYAYGAPSVGNRSPGKPPSQNGGSPPNHPPLNTSNDIEAEEEARASSRYYRLKERNQVLASRPGYTRGPGIITDLPVPTDAQLKDTSVIIASAFHQAAASSLAGMANETWRSGNANLPRSTSVEYEKETQQTSHRRLAVPANRARPNSSKPNSRASNRGISDVEESRATASRAKSPFDHLADLTRRAMSPAGAATSFLLRAPSRELPDVLPRTTSRQPTETTLVGQNSESYDYAAEEEEMQRIDKTSSHASSSSSSKKIVRPPSNRIPTDNQAYEPSDETESESDVDESGRRTRRRKKKKDGAGGPLTTLPITQYDKRKKRKGRGGKNGENEESGSEDEPVEIQNSRRSHTPLSRQLSVPRGSAPPPSRSSVTRQAAHTSVDSSFDRPSLTDHSVDPESGTDYRSGLDPISELDESALEPPDVPRRRMVFGVGYLLGSLCRLLWRLARGTVGLVLRAAAGVALLFGQCFGLLYKYLILTPYRHLTSGRSWIPVVFKYLLLTLGMYAGWTALRYPTFGDLPGFPLRNTPVYKHPDIPAATVEQFATRLLKLENALGDLQRDTVTSHSKLEMDVKKQREIIGTVNYLETRIEKETLRAQKGEEDTRQAALRAVEAMSRDLRALQGLVDSVAKHPPPSSDNEARAKLRVLEDKMDGYEVSVRTAMEMAQISARTGGSASGLATPEWINKLDTRLKGLSIKASDGSDVSSLISYLVENTFLRYTKDDLARVDWALFTGGARVIPSYTSQTWELKAPGNMFSNLFSGKVQHVGLSPIHALHHERHAGSCWPFRGSQGRIGVHLIAPVYISDITIDHVAKENAYEIGTAPQEMELWGLVDGADNMEKYQQYIERKAMEKQEALAHDMPYVDDQAEPYPGAIPSSAPFLRIASLQYNINLPNNVQTFPISKEIKDLNMDFGVVILVIKSNWGADFTCLYRLRVHGERYQPPPIEPSSADS